MNAKLKNTGSWLGLIAASILEKFGRSNTKPTPADLQKMEFKTSTQKLGVRTTEKIRNIFRGRWIKKS